MAIAAFVLALIALVLVVGHSMMRDTFNGGRAHAWGFGSGGFGGGSRPQDNRLPTVQRTDFAPSTGGVIAGV